MEIDSAQVFEPGLPRQCLRCWGKHGAYISIASALQAPRQRFTALPPLPAPPAPAHLLEKGPIQLSRGPTPQSTAPLASGRPSWREGE